MTHKQKVATTEFGDNTNDVKFRQWPQWMYHKDGRNEFFQSQEDMEAFSKLKGYAPGDWAEDPIAWATDGHLRGRHITGSGDPRLRYPTLEPAEALANNPPAAPATPGLPEDDKDAQRVILVNEPVRDPQVEEAAEAAQKARK